MNAAEHALKIRTNNIFHISTFIFIMENFTNNEEQLLQINHIFQSE